MLAGANGLVNDNGLKQAVTSLKTTLDETQQLVHRLNTASAPLARDLPGMTKQLDTAMKRLNAFVGSLNSGYGANSNLHNQATRLMAQLNEAVQALRSFADLLQRHPEALLRGRR